MENPFKYGGILRGPYFADRQEEIGELEREMENGSRVFLVSPRRYGKTCLLHNLMEKIRKKRDACAYIDLNAFPDMASLAVGMTARMVGALETGGDRLLKLFSGFKMLRPNVSLDQYGSVTAGLELAVPEKDALSGLLEGMQEAERLACRKNRRLVVIIDEFSDLPKYNGRVIEKALRSEIQQHSRSAYIFAGSEQSVMLSMLQDPNRAFYKMGRIMELGAIEREAYLAFIGRWLEKGGYTFDYADLAELLSLGENVPYNIQRLCHVMWERALESKTIDRKLIATLPGIIARQDSPHYQMFWRSATQRQKRLLMAIGRDRDTRIFSKEFQFRHGIGPASSIRSSLDSLVKKGIVQRNPDGRYRFVDRFMPVWIELMGQSANPEG